MQFQNCTVLAPELSISTTLRMSHFAVAAVLLCTAHASTPCGRATIHHTLGCFNDSAWNNMGPGESGVPPMLTKDLLFCGERRMGSTLLLVAPGRAMCRFFRIRLRLVVHRAIRCICHAPRPVNLTHTRNNKHPESWPRPPPPCPFPVLQRARQPARAVPFGTKGLSSFGYMYTLPGPVLPAYQEKLLPATQ